MATTKSRHGQGQVKETGAISGRSPLKEEAKTYKVHLAGEADRESEFVLITAPRRFLAAWSVRSCLG
jgi:hypothetical protein